MLLELDKLAEKVEIARATIVRLRDVNRALESESTALRAELEELRAKGATPEMFAEHTRTIGALIEERDALLAERETVAERVRTILGKVEALEELS
jgi:FtsZ-binding cell division protein ZapB